MFWSWMSSSRLLRVGALAIARARARLARLASLPRLCDECAILLRMLICGLLDLVLLTQQST